MSDLEHLLRNNFKNKFFGLFPRFKILGIKTFRFRRVMLLRATRFHSEVHPKWVPRVMISGQVETDKWPLVLARGCGRERSDHGRRRGRVSFDG